MLQKTEKTNATIVAEIHAEFDLASENLLMEAKQIAEKDLIGERLLHAGFNSIERVKTMERKADYSRMAETVRYYVQKYPFYKFITPLQVKEICKKYSLFCGDTGMFIGEIPDKNINEILTFNLAIEDAPSKETGWSTFGRENNFEKIFLSEGLWCEKKEIEKIDREKQMKICAPKEMFDRTNSWGNSGDLSVKDGYMLVLDPIVLQPVKGGYLIVSKWGLEGEDADLTNEKLN